MGDEQHGVNAILDRLERVGARRQELSIGEIVGAFGHRSYGPFLLVPPLIGISPIGTIPTVPTIVAAIIALFSVQILLGREQMWLPRFIRERTMATDKVGKATAKLRPVARFMDRWFHGRLPALTRGPFVRVAAALSLALCLVVPPLELLPWASAAPMLTIAMVGLALLVHDGALMVAALLVGASAVAIGLGLVGH
jgi:hypothetical protein